MICAVVAVFVSTHVCLRIQLQNHSTSIRKNRANGVAVLDVALFGITEPPSNNATLLALFGGNLRVELHCSANRANRAIVLQSS